MYKFLFSFYGCTEKPEDIFYRKVQNPDLRFEWLF